MVAKALWGHSVANVHYPKSDFKTFSIEQSSSETGHGIVGVPSFSFDIEISLNTEANIMYLLLDI